MSAVSMPMPITRIRSRTIRFGRASGACLSRSRRAFSICWICSATSCLRARSRWSSAGVLGGIGALGRVWMFEAVRRRLELGIEAANTEARQGRLDAVDDRGVLANEGLALAVGTLGILICEGRNRAHLAV